MLTVALPVSMVGLLASADHAQAVTEIGGQKVVTMPSGDNLDTYIGGQKIVELTRAAVSTTKPEFTSVTCCPDAGWSFCTSRPTFPARAK